MKEFGGSKHDMFNAMLANDVVRSMWLQPGWSTEDLERRKTSALVAIIAFRPQDEIEAMLAAQAVAMHATSMECSRRAMIDNQPLEAAQGLRKAAVNASRAFIELSAALDRKRGKGGKQTVRVEHVHIHPGGQAIVGHVSTKAGQGEGGRKAEGEPHAAPAALEHDPTAGAGVTTLSGQDADRLPVSVPSDDEWPMQDARRRQHRTSHRRGD
jgi:hypothetical protein